MQENSGSRGGERLEISLRAARVNAGFTQKQVMDLTGFARSTIISWEQGKTSPRAKDLELLCKLYGIPMDCIKK